MTASNFSQEVLESKLPVLVDFWASWCSPCKMMEPAIDSLASELDGKLIIAKLNVDQNAGLAFDFAVNGVPTFIIFKDGKEINRKVGAQSTEQLKTFLAQVLK